MEGEVLFRAYRTTGGKGTIMGLCMECALRRHDFHEMVGNGTNDEGPPATPPPQALIDGRRHMLLSHAWTHQETCSECKQTTPTLYVPMK
jgi:hypothetical protein